MAAIFGTALKAANFHVRKPSAPEQTRSFTNEAKRHRFSLPAKSWMYTQIKIMTSAVNI